MHNAATKVSHLKKNKPISQNNICSWILFEMANVTQQSTRDAGDAMSFVQQNSVTQDIHGLFCSKSSIIVSAVSPSRTKPYLHEWRSKELTWISMPRILLWSVVCTISDRWWDVSHRRQNTAVRVSHLTELFFFPLNNEKISFFFSFLKLYNFELPNKDNGAVPQQQLFISRGSTRI